MGSLDSFDRFKPGRVGSLVFYKRNGKTFVKLHQPKVKQTAATKLESNTFGRAIALATPLRQGITPIMHNKKDRAIMYTMNTAVQSWLKTKPDLTVSHDRLEHLHDLDINERGRIKFSLQVDWSQPGMVHVKIPAFNPVKDLAIKAGTINLVWKLAVTGVTTGKFPLAVNGSQTEFTIPYTKEDLPERTVCLPYNLEPGTINIVAIALHLHYDQLGTRQKQKTWEPAGLVGAWWEA